MVTPLASAAGSVTVSSTDYRAYEGAIKNVKRYRLYVAKLEGELAQATSEVPAIHQELAVAQGKLQESQDALNGANAKIQELEMRPVDARRVTDLEREVEGYRGERDVMVTAGQLFSAYHEEHYGGVIGEMASLPGIGEFVGEFPPPLDFDEFVKRARIQESAQKRPPDSEQS